MGHGNGVLLTKGQTDAEEKKIRIIREELYNEMDRGFNNIDMILDKEGGKGLFGPLLRQLEKLIYNFFGREPIKQKTVNQIELIFKTAQLLNKGVEMQEIGRKYFKDYIKNEETYHRCNRKHPKFRTLIEYMKKSFESRITQVAKILKLGEGDTYPELI
ncbi:MAG: hypothetical protein ACTSRA_05160, partial [Promethearchaeota archaeon]